MAFSKSNLFPVLLVDIGNSFVKWALVDNQGDYLHAGSYKTDHLHQNQFFQIDANKTDDLNKANKAIHQFLSDWHHLSRPNSIWFTNVTGLSVAKNFLAVSQTIWPLIQVNEICACQEQCGVKNSYQNTSKLGSDRWAALIGARSCYPDEAILIASFGTATTTELLDKNGYFIGGLIIPSWNLMAQSLAENTANLPLMTTNLGSSYNHSTLLSKINFKENKSVATDTENAIAIGCIGAQVALIERLWHCYTKKWNTDLRCVITGGGTATIASQLSIPFTKHNDLIFEGMLEIVRTAESKKFSRRATTTVND